MTKLITVPTFTFSQGDVFEGNELPIQVSFYNNGDEPLIELSQEDRDINFTSISHLKNLLKEVIKHHEEAKAKLNQKTI